MSGPTDAAPSPRVPPRPGMVWVPGGTFRMGSDRFYPEERPVRAARVGGFWIDRHPVTNRQFVRFAQATGYVTVAERAPDPARYPGAPAANLVPGSMVFFPTPGPVDLRDNARWWRWTPGADWRHPRGPGSSIALLAAHPVVHVALDDVLAYCAWAEVGLPTEAEWERAARGSRDQAVFPWGDDERPDGFPMANTWQGQFPWQNTEEDGYRYTSPVGSYPANDFGLLDMVGNVWEWTADWYAAARDEAGGTACCGAPRSGDGAAAASVDPANARSGMPRKVVKGGSHLCAPNYCLRYRPAARQPQETDTGMSHVGFRCVARPAS